MTRHRLASVILTVLAPFAFAACSDQSPVAPNGGLDGLQYVATLAQPVEGTYTLSFQATGTGLGVVLVAYVTDAFGNPAQSGTAVFQFCSLQGDPAPSAACDTGSGGWAFWGRAGIIPSPFPLAGHALIVYDLVPPAGTTIGFRFRYLGQGNGIANGVSASGDHTF